MFFGLFGRKKIEAAPLPMAPAGLFSTDGEIAYDGRRARVQLPEFVAPVALARPKPASTAPTAGTEGEPADSVGMDEDDTAGDIIKPNYSLTGSIPDAQLGWYAAQSFIGYQLCALLAQHWLIDKACSLPGKDIVRKGWDITANDGEKLDPKVLKQIGKIDKAMRINRHLMDYIRKGRIFGIRIAMFKVESDDLEYYSKPFNIDGVKPGAYKGIVQIDPYWITPELITQNLINPDDLHFYEPEYWRISGTGLVHRSHLVIFTTGDVPDVLKPSYFYGGVSVPQRIYERVYAAERTANEAPMLAMTKRLNVLKTDISAALADEVLFNQRMEWAQQARDNYGTRVVGEDDDIEQFDLTLADLDNVIMTQYQLCASIAGVPGTKLLGTQPKGFNSTGEFEESSYHEELESIRANDMEPLLDRHYLLTCKSYIEPVFKVQVTIEIAWNELDAMTAAEGAEVQQSKAATAAIHIANGAIEPAEERARIVADPDSGYNGLPVALPPMPDSPAPDAGGNPQEPGQEAPPAPPPPAVKITAPQGA